MRSRGRRGLAKGRRAAPGYALNSRATALFTSILAFAGSATNAPAAAAAPNARRDFSTSGSGALDGLRAAAEATRTKKQRIDACVRREDKLQGQQSESNLHNN